MRKKIASSTVQEAVQNNLFNQIYYTIINITSFDKMFLLGLTSVLMRTEVSMESAENLRLARLTCAMGKVLFSVPLHQ